MSADVSEVTLWQRVCERLATELPEQQFNTWIRPLPAAEVIHLQEGNGEDAVLVSLRVPNRFKLDWIRSQYAGRIELILGELAGKPARLELSLAPRETIAPLPRNSAPVASMGQVLQQHKGHAWLSLCRHAREESLKRRQAAGGSANADDGKAGSGRYGFPGARRRHDRV